jgi:hypothetical protein
VLVSCAIICTNAALAQSSANDALLNLLVKKGVLSAEDVAELKRELATPLARSTAGTQAITPPESAPVPAAAPSTEQGSARRLEIVAARPSNPMSFRIGGADFTPFGFVDLTGYYRTTDVGSGVGTNFASIPYSNTSPGQLSETRLTAQNSRLGLKVDSTIDDVQALGYVETDFLGNSASTLYTTSNSATLRMRLYFADFKWRRWEFLAGQSWSMLTPNRVAISPIPSDISYTMDMDISYQAGLVWARQPQIRAVYHATSELTAGVSLENPDQYVGGSSGTPVVTLPSAFNSSEVDSGVSTASPNWMPDVVGKLAYDTKVNDLPWHAEVAGVYRQYKVNTYTSGSAPVNAGSSADGAGASFNFDLQLVKGLSLIGDTYYSRGGGRYIFGQAPDFVVNPANASGAFTVSPLTAWSYIGGLEWQATRTTTIFGYYSQVGIGKKYDQLSNGGYVGYGYPGSPNTQNKDIEEYTFGATQTLWKSPGYGALQLIEQASYVDRNPWFVAPGAPTVAHAGVFYFDLRYVLP